MTFVATAQVITVLARSLNPEQRLTAAARLRELEGDRIDRQFYETCAQALEEYGRRETHAVPVTREDFLPDGEPAEKDEPF